MGRQIHLPNDWQHQIAAVALFTMAKLFQLKEEENNNKIMKLKPTSGGRLIIPWGQKQVLKVSSNTASQRCAYMAHSEKMLKLNTAVQQCTRYSLRHWHTGKWQMLSLSQTAWALMILMSLILPYKSSQISLLGVRTMYLIKSLIFSITPTV